MAQDRVDLIPMAEIARLAGQSRATVGNWKSRNPEAFPRERGRGPRGPLYDRAEVIAWLEATNRLDKGAPEVSAIWHLANQFRGEMRTEDALPLLLLLLAVMSKASASEWRTLKASDDSNLFATLRASVVSLFPFAEELLPTVELPSQSIARAISTLSTVDQPRGSIMADALLEQAANAMGHRGGELLSPPSVRKLMISIAEPTGTVYSPATGVGQLMIDAATNAASAPLRLVGQESNSRVWAMSQLNLAIHNVDADVALADVFADDRFPQLQADRVIAVPPWNQRLPILELLGGDPRWVWGEPGPNDGNAAWTQHCLSHLADEGRAVIVLPNGVLFEGGRAGRIRQRIIKAGLLDAVVGLPPGLFAWTQLPCSVLVFAKGRRNVDGKPAPTLMVDLAESAHVQGGRSTNLDDDLIDAVAELYSAWVVGKTPTADFAAVAPFDDLAANEFVIDPSRYRTLPRIATDIEKVTVKRSKLLDGLAALKRTSREKDEQLNDDPRQPSSSTFQEIRLSELAATLTITRGIPTQRVVRDGEQLDNFVRVMSVADLRNAAPARHFADRDEIADLGLDLARRGDVLVSIEGGTVGETLVVHDHMDAFVPSQQVATLRVIDETRLDPGYLGAWLSTEPAREQVRRLARGGGIQRIPIKDLASLLIRVPSLRDQRDIGQRFLAFETAIASHRAVGKCLRDLRDVDLVLMFANETAQPEFDESDGTS